MMSTFYPPVWRKLDQLIAQSAAQLELDREILRELQGIRASLDTITNSMTRRSAVTVFGRPEPQ